jgi:hypothetical protein
MKTTPLATSMRAVKIPMIVRIAPVLLVSSPAGPR